MPLEGLLDMLSAQPGYRRLLTQLGSGKPEGQIEVTPPPGARPYLLAALWQHLARSILVVVPGPEDARQMYNNLAGYLGDDAPLYHMPEPEALPYERLLPDSATANDRLRVLSALAGGGPVLVVASAAAVLRTVPDPVVFRQLHHTLHVGQEASPEDLARTWVRLGYRATEGVEIPGTFGKRGGILDVFPPNSTLPARLEFWGETIESIRRFDPFTQRSVEQVEAIEVLPAQEVLPLLADQDKVWRTVMALDFSICRDGLQEMMHEEISRIFAGHEVTELAFYAGLFNRHTLVHHLGPDGLVVMDGPGQVEAEALEIEERADDLRRAREARGELPKGFPSNHLTWKDFQSILGQRPLLHMGGWTASEDVLGLSVVPSFAGKVEEFIAQARGMVQQGTGVVVVSRHAKRLQELFAEQGVAVSPQEGLETQPEMGHISLVSGSLRQGWSLAVPWGRLSLFTDGELFGMAKERRLRRKGAVPQTPFTLELAPGSYVVHVDHGVARFAGTVKMGEADAQREYLVLEYAEGDKLYVPTDQLDRVSAYTSPSDRSPSLTRLGTGEWNRAKSRAKGSAKEMARELLKLYAKRATVEGIAFSDDTPWQAELEDSFPYEETRDQARTIHEVKLDMERPIPMDRLVCGDVGYGKTEVALRGAFKAVASGYQVALLVPTTVLAQQHFQTFAERLLPFPVRVEVLSRFRSKQEQKRVVEDLASGQVDIVIGTHRLLQKDVSFKKLGLVIVDEEQRFGVSHKERLKSMRQDVDVLTLTATPIPRTLNMAFTGLRDMSTMETPPEERLPVRTYVGEYSPDLVKEAILREMERGGQVFFLHNRVHSIYRVARELEALVPQARFTVAHGRMDEAALEAAMTAFANGEADVLVCTTIIESGLDIPNANTLIIDRADMLGLAQLYQLRGRVGRGVHRAHAYLFVPRGRQITEAAKKRLQAILEASELGAGFRIAMRDLEIRGAGNILGAEQSGNIQAVGFELYSHLLQEAIAELRAEEAGQTLPEKPVIEVRVDLGLSAHIPESYIEHLPARLAVYQRLARVQERNEVADMDAELRDRFGPLPQPVSELLYVVEVKVLARQAGVESVVRSDGEVALTLKEAIGSARLVLQKELGGDARVGHRQVRLGLHPSRKGWREELLQALERLIAFRERMESLAPTACR